MVYDTSTLRRPRYFVRVYKDDEEDATYGSVSDETTVRHFTLKDKITWTDEAPHYFAGVPATCYQENKEMTGLFEPAMSLINAYNKAISEKANDVDYFADAYLLVLGAFLDEEDVKHIRDDRIINFDGDAEKLIVKFLEKPNGDETQEHLIDRLEKLIFMVCMVANISDDEFGTQSGIAIKYKLQAMSNLAMTKERKFTSGMNRRYKLIFSNPASHMEAEDWVKVTYHFTQNYPANLAEQAKIAKDLEGVVSKETQLKVISIVESAADEIEKLKKEQEEQIDPVTQLMFGGDEHDDNK